MSVQSLLQTRYEQLSPGGKRVAGTLLSDPRTALTHTVSQLAQLSGVSDATVIRLCRELGLRGYKELRLTLASELGQEAGEFGRTEVHGADIDPSEPLSDVIDRVARLEMMAIRETLANLDVHPLGDAVNALAGAGRIVAFGVEASSLCAEDLRRKLFRVGLPAYGFSDAHEAIGATPLLKPGDVAVAISHSGRTSDVVEFAQRARSYGATTIAITNDARSALHDAADLPLLTYAREMTLRSSASVSRIAQLAVVDCLFYGLLQIIHEDAVPALKETFDVLRDRKHGS